MTMKIKKNDITLFTKIGDLYPDPLYDGIISIILNADSELKTAVQSIIGEDNSMLIGTELNYFSKSKDKSISILVETSLELGGIELKQGDDYYIPTFNTNTFIANALLSKYKYKWLKLINTVKLNYDPLKPYNMKVDDNLVNENLKSHNQSSNKSSNSDDNNNSYFGFNSENSVPTDYSNNKSQSENSRNEDYTRDLTSSRVIQRNGNIGNKSNQQLIEEEREINKWLFINEFFKDIDKLVTNPKWE